MIGPDFYKDLTASALDVAKSAMDVIEWQLPQSVIVQLNQKKKHANDPYNDIKFWYLGQEQQQHVVVRLLDDLVQISHAVAKLRSVVAEIPPEPVEGVNLQIARHR